jgi:hypothetical protein
MHLVLAMEGWGWMHLCPSCWIVTRGLGWVLAVVLSWVGGPFWC